LQTSTKKACWDFLKILFTYLRESTSRGRRRGRSRLPTEQGARRGAPPQDPEIMTEPPRSPSWDFDFDYIENTNSGRTDILTTLSLPIHEHSLSCHYFDL